MHTQGRFMNLEEHIRNLGLNKRVMHNLLAEKIFTIKQLMGLSENDILKIPNIARKGLQNIKDTLEKIQNNEPRMLQDIGSKLMSVERKVNMLIELMEKLVEGKLTVMSQEMNGLRTVMLEQYRLIQAIQLEKSPEGLLRKINEKVPGFSSTIYDLYEKLEQI